MFKNTYLSRMIKFTKINTCSLFFKGFNSNLSNFYKNLSNCHVHTINIIDVGNQATFEPVMISNIRDNKGSRPLRTRVGRGPGSGKGKTSARGHKGYKAHVGNINRHYEGGQTPITRKLPKHGFRRSRTLREPYAYINLEKIIYLVLKGRLDPTKTITIRDLVWSGGISKSEWGVKVLARGADRLKDIPPLNLEVSSATQIAVDEIKKHGGSVSSVYRNKLTLKYHIKPWKFIRAPLDPLPPFRQTLRLMQLEEKGVNVKYIKPRWAENDSLKYRALYVKRKMETMKNADLLPQYPIKIEPNMSDNKIRKRRPTLFKKLVFDQK